LLQHHLDRAVVGKAHFHRIGFRPWTRFFLGLLLASGTTGDGQNNNEQNPMVAGQHVDPPEVPQMPAIQGESTATA